MKTSVEQMGQIRRAVTVEVPAETVSANYAKALEKVRQEAKVPGFRKGKVPDQILVQRYEEEIVLETVKQIVRETYPEAMRELNVRPLGDPSIEPQGKFERGQPFTYKAVIEVYPDFRAEGYDGLELEREPVTIAPGEVNAELLRLQQQMTQLEPAPEGAIGPGTIAMIDFKGTAGGEAFAGSEAENYVVDFGTGHLLEEFEVRIQGMKAAEEREIEFEYPATYFKKEIAGKLGAFRVKVREVRRKIVPELNDEFAKELGKFSTLDEVRGELEKRLREFKELMIRNALRERSIRILVEKHKELEPPTSLVEAELGNMLNQLEQQLRAKGKSLADVKVEAADFVKANVEEATNRARGYMIVDAIAKQEHIEVTEEEVTGRIEALAAANRQPAAKVREHMEKENLLGQLRGQVRFEKALDFVLSKAKITEVEAKKDEKNKK